eukprot:COSAG01_NODE_31120_length_603_cov_1.325397_1_plen_169_part_01
MSADGYCKHVYRSDSVVHKLATKHHESKELHPVSKRAKTLGADIRDIPSGGQSVPEAHARKYCEDKTRACLLPFGCDDPIIIGAIKDAALSIPSACLHYVTSCVRCLLPWPPMGYASCRLLPRRWVGRCHIPSISTTASRANMLGLVTLACVCALYTSTLRQVSCVQNG